MKIAKLHNSSRYSTKKSKRISSYLESEIWEYDQLLKLKHIRVREKYSEGEVHHEVKIGSELILLTMSFPYVRDE